MKTFLKIALFFLWLLNGLIFVATVIDLLKGWVGGLAYVLWIFVAPLMSPAILGLPWFESWVSEKPVNDNLLFIWGALVVGIILSTLLSFSKGHDQ